MNPETEKLLGILEFYNHGRMFVWDKTIKGNFNIWKLLISEGFVTESEPDKAIKHWLQTEFWGTITNQKYNDIQYAPLRRLLFMNAVLKMMMFIKMEKELLDS